MDNNRRLSGHNTTPVDILYSDLLFGRRLRPDAQMPIENHRECGLLLRQVARATEGRRGVSERVRFVFNTLDAWVQREYGWDELDMETLAGLYCPGPRIDAQGPVGLPVLVEWLDGVKSILVAHYPLGLALNELLRDIDRAIASIRKWDGKPKGKVYREPVAQSEVRFRQRA